MKHVLKAMSLSCILAAPIALTLPAGAQQGTDRSAQAWQQAWQLTRQQFPALQAADFQCAMADGIGALADAKFTVVDLRGEFPHSTVFVEQAAEGAILTVSQASLQQEMAAFDNSHYTFWDAKVLAGFWKQGVQQTKADMGGKLLSGAGATLDDVLRDARAQALQSVDQLTLFSSSQYRFEDAEALAKFWGEPSTWNAKLRIERNLITGNEQAVQTALNQAHTVVANPGHNNNNNNNNNNNGNNPARIDNVLPAPGQTQATSRPEVSVSFSGQVDRNSLRFWVDSLERTQELNIFTSPGGGVRSVGWKPSSDVGSGLHSVEIRAIGFNGESLSRQWSFLTSVQNNNGNMNNNTTGSVTNMQPSPGQAVSTRRPDVTANFSGRLNRNSLTLLVDSLDHTQELTFSADDQFVRWTPTMDLVSGNHAVELRAVGLNGESYSKTWTFSTPRKISNAPSQPTLPLPTVMQVNNLQPGQQLGSRFNVVGRGVPGSQVVVQVDYPKQDVLSKLGGVMLHFQNRGTVDQTGNFSIPLDAQEVPEGEVMTINVTDSANSPIVSLNTKKGPDNLFQPSGQNQGSSSNSIEKFYDQRNNFGLDIPPGWGRNTPGNNMTLKLNNNGSTFEVGVGPAQSPQGAINSARNMLQQQGAQIQNQFPVKIGGLAATRLDYAVPARGLFGRLVICVTGRNQTFLVSAESANFNVNPINSDVTSMFNSFLINAR